MEKNNLWLSLIIFIILFLSSGCKKNVKHKSKNLKLITNSLTNTIDSSFKLEISGIECKLCAKNVIDKIKEDQNISKTVLYCKNNSFENCYVIINLKDKSKNLDIDDIKVKLKNEGFVLKNITKLN